MSADPEGRTDSPDAMAPERCDQHVPLTRADGKKLAAALGTELAAVRAVVEKTLRKVTRMSVSVDKLDADIQILIAGYQAAIAANAQLTTALQAADATKAQAVADAIVAEDADAQAKIDAADAVVAAANPAPPAPPATP